MRAEDLRTMDIFHIDPETGFPMMGSVRVLAMGARLVGSLYSDLVDQLGEEAAGKTFMRFGYQSGLGQATNMADMYDWDSDEEWFKACAMLHAHAGAAKTVFTDLELDRAAGVMSFKGQWHHSKEAMGWAESGEVAEHPVCNIVAGMVSGYASACLGSEVMVSETSCQAQGHAHCTFEGRTAPGWGLNSEEVREFFALGSVEEEVGRLKGALAEAKAQLEHSQAELAKLRANATRDNQTTGGFIFRSEAMGKVLELASKVAGASTTVLIQGETGTGKEVLARYLHNHSGRAKEPYMAINCAALPAGLLESELFGHVKGAFTGADKDQEGLFIKAGKGTLFLDEVGEMALELQAKLLRALQEKEVRPVGGGSSRKITARIVAATNRDLKSRVAEGVFREDLYYRLAVIPINLPPLRERRQDILPLARHFLAYFRSAPAAITPPAVRMMESYDWPGNVRELENAMEYAAVLAAEKAVDVSYLPMEVVNRPVDPLENLVGDLPSEKDLLRRYTGLLLDHTNGNKTEAARIMGIGPNTLWRRMRSWDAEEKVRP